MELRQMQYFHEVCKTSNFTQAAANLFVAQPCVTTAIHKLEAELGVKLFDRTNKKVSLTGEGQVFYERVKVLLDMVNDTAREMLDFNNPNRATIRLGMPVQLGTYFFPKIFLEFAVLYPEIKLNIIEEGTLAVLKIVEKGELDIGLIILPDNPVNVVTRPVRREPLLLCLSPENPLSRRGSVHFTELKDQKFILRKADSYQRGIVLQECRRCGFEPNIILSSSQVQTIKSLVANNVGIAFFNEMITKDDPGIVAVPLAEPLYSTIGLVLPKGKYISRAAQAFIDFVIATSGKPDTLK